MAKKIPCIPQIKGIGRELHLSIASSTISDDELREFFGLFTRYNFENVKQLEVFKHKDNAYWFDE